MPEIQQPSAASKGTGGSPEYTAQFASFSREIVTCMRDVSQLADKRASTFLLTLGTVLLILTMFWRLRPAGVQVSNLEPAEFITVAIVAALFVLSGSFIRLYQDHLMGAVGKEIRDTGAKLLERSQEAAIVMAQKGQERDDRGA